jgi:uncharacterized protein YcfJ
MKKLLLSTLVLVSFGAVAQETGRVISSMPVIQQVAVQRQSCTQQQVAVQQQPSGAGALLGAIVGAAVGNGIGGGMGHAAAIGLGTVAGAAVGNGIEGRGQGVQNVQTCTPQTFSENRTVGYNVTYEFNGKQYMVRMANDPGPTVNLQVTPVGSSAPATGAPGVVTAPPISQVDDTTQVVAVRQPVQTVVYPGYVYPASYPSYWYPPLALSLGYVWYGGGGGGHPRHFR